MVLPAAMQKSLASRHQQRLTYPMRTFILSACLTLPRPASHVVVAACVCLGVGRDREAIFSNPPGAKRVGFHFY